VNAVEGEGPWVTFVLTIIPTTGINRATLAASAFRTRTRNVSLAPFAVVAAAGSLTMELFIRG